MKEEEKDAYIKKLVQSNVDQHNKIVDLSKKVYDLQKESYRKEAQIEKMKCCENCRYCNEWGEANSNSPNCKKCNWVSNWKLRR